MVHILIDKIDLGSFHDDLGTYIWHFIFTREPSQQKTEGKKALQVEHMQNRSAD